MSKDKPRQGISSLNSAGREYFSSVYSLGTIAIAL